MTLMIGNRKAPMTMLVIRHIFLLVILASTVSLSTALDNGLGLTPPMGWSSWNHYGCQIDEPLMKAVADAMVSTGLKDLGYEYLNLDDCWQKTRDLRTGQIQPDSDKFPSGMQALGDYIHSKGLKFGLYSDAGLLTCQRRPGSLGLENIDAKTYASWNVDWLKYDNCYSFGLDPKRRYTTMRDALNATGRPIYFAMCEWGWEDPATWAAPIGNSWRTTTDIQANWQSIMNLADKNDPLFPYAGPGGWNDPDMLEVGNGQLTTEQQRSHFTLWAIMKAPLILGNDIQNMAQETMDIIGNKKIIAINQDPLGEQAHSIWSSGEDKAQQVWAGRLSGGAFVVAFLNRDGSQPANITVHWKDIPHMYSETTTMQIEDLWCDWNTTATGSFTGTVNPYDVMAIRMSTKDPFLAKRHGMARTGLRG